MKASQKINQTFRDYLSTTFEGHALEEFMERDDTQAFLDLPLYSRVKSLFDDQHAVLDDYEDRLEDVEGMDDYDEIVGEMLEELLKIQ